MSMAIADSEALLKRNSLVLLDIEDGVQPARVGSQYPEVAAEQCQISAEFVAGTDRPAVQSKPDKTTELHGGFSLQDQGLSRGKPVFILQKALSICRQAVY
jgi:hypothetical protein